MNVTNVPLKLKSTRVWRTYTGGKLLEEWLGYEQGEDGEYPEDWIASVTGAAYGAGGNPTKGYDGLSFVNHEDEVLLKDLIDQDPEYYLGKAHLKEYGKNTALLTKMIDSAERLTIQVHPDNEKAQSLFDSRYGKTEAWYIIDCREIDGEKPYVLLGLKEGVTREQWEEMFHKQDIVGMNDALHRFNVEPGQVFLLEGGTPHAIGPGCLLVEIQEPTDLTLRVEKTTPKGRVIPDELCHLGLGFEKMFDCFNYQTYSFAEISNKYMLKPSVLSDTEAATEWELIGYHHTKCFRMTLTEIREQTELEPNPTFSAAVVTSGEGTVHYGDVKIPVRQGEQLFIPAGLDQSIHCQNNGTEPLKLIRCFPPQSN